MKNIYICNNSKLKSRFIENIKNLDGLNIITTSSNTDIYKYYHSGIKNYIVSAESVDNNLRYFINDKNDIKVFIDNTLNTLKLETFSENVKYLIDARQKNIESDTIDVSKYINTSLFYRPEPDTNRVNIAAGFLNSIEEIPYNLLKKIYAGNLPFKVRLFDNPTIHNIFNVGILSEEEKSKILKEYKYFINIDNNYLNEAIVSGAIILNGKTLDVIIPNEKESEITDINNFVEYLI
jgi:hypothetical protein